VSWVKSRGMCLGGENFFHFSSKLLTLLWASVTAYKHRSWEDVQSFPVNLTPKYCPPPSKKFVSGNLFRPGSGNPNYKSLVRDQKPVIMCNAMSGVRRR